MKQTIFRAAALLFFSLFLVSSREERPRILIIGDSISIGYTPFVAEQLAGVADVVHNEGNAQHTGTGMSKLHEWVGKEKWDIIQFNWGLWDLAYRHPDSQAQGNRDKVNGNITYTVREYANNLESIVNRLEKTTDAKLIFVTTTYVPENEIGRFKKDPAKYNRAAIKVMKKHKIEVNDIYKASVDIHHQYGLGEDDVHYAPEGYDELGKLISAHLRKALNEDK